MGFGLGVDAHRLCLSGSIEHGQVVRDLLFSQNVELLAFSNNTDSAVLDVQLSGLLILNLFGGLIRRQRVTQRAHSVEDQVLAITGLNVRNMLLQVSSRRLATVSNGLSSPVVEHARGAGLIDVSASLL